MVTMSPTNGPGVATSGPNVAMGGRGLVHEEEHAPMARISEGLGFGWGAVIAGCLGAIALLTLSALLAYACGVPAYTGGVYGVGAGFWAGVSSLIAFWAAGMISASARWPQRAASRALHGFVSWALAVGLLLLLSLPALGLAQVPIITNLLHMTILPPMTEPTWATMTGAAWCTFIALSVGLLASIFGGLTGSVCGKSQMR